MQLMRSCKCQNTFYPVGDCITSRPALFQEDVVHWLFMYTYVLHLWLSALISYPSPSNHPGLVVGRKDKSIYHTVEEALCYLDARTEFWRQQKPMYTRKREKETKKYKPSPTKPQTRQYPFLEWWRKVKLKILCLYPVLTMGIRLRWCFSTVVSLTAVHSGWDGPYQVCAQVIRGDRQW